MNNIEDVAKETLVVLNYFDYNFVSQIPKAFLEKLKIMSEKSNILVSIDRSKKLVEQKISEECKDLISLIYYNCIANENDKKEILDCWIINEKNYQNDLSKKYNTDKLFKNKKDISKTAEENITKKVTLIEYKESIFKKILKKFFSIFKR